MDQLVALLREAQRQAEAERSLPRPAVEPMTCSDASVRFDVPNTRGPQNA